MDEHGERIVEHLDMLNRKIAKQHSFFRIFLVGITYGIGFFLGSAIIATIALGVFGPWFADIPWIRNSFEAGAALLRQ